MKARAGQPDRKTRNQVALALWAAACAEHVLGRFEDARPDDGRPREAIEAARAWACGEITVGQARRAAFAAHAAARTAGGSNAGGAGQPAAPSASVAAAVAAARAAGHAAATAHVPTHSRGAALYAVAAVSGAAFLAAADDTSTAAVRERAWQLRRLPKGLRSKYPLPT